MDPYGAQTYPPNQDPYLYNQSQQYPYYPQIPPPQYPNPNPTQEHAPIHPPGVPVQNDPNVAAYHHGYGPTHFQHDPNAYYAQQPPPQPQPQVGYTDPQQQLGYPDPNMAHQAQQPWQQQGQTVEYGLTALYPPNGQGGQPSSAGRGGGRGSRGGSFSTRGRGRGRGRGGNTTPAIVSQPKPQVMAWCELCRVDCNTHEILENHKNGKKHKKNLKIQEDLQKLAAKTQEAQMAAAAVEKPVEGQVAVSEEQVNSLKRKAIDGERKAGEVAKKQKEIVPFICELCNVKCESSPTFDSHLKGKKHAFNLQRFQEQQVALGQAALQALYPALEALYPALLQAVSENVINPSSSTGLDQQVMQWLQAYLPQNGPMAGPQGPPGPAQEGLTEVDPKTAEKVGPESKNEEQVGVESKTEELVGVESKTEEQVGAESKTEEEVGAESKTEEEGGPESKSEEKVEDESKTEEVDLSAAKASE